MRFNLQDVPLPFNVSATAVLFLVCVTLPNYRTLAQDEEIESANEFQPGLIAEYSTESANSTLTRIVPTATVTEATGTRDVAVRWKGRLFIRYGNRFEIRPYGSGSVSITLRGEELLSEENTSAGWFKPVTVDLDYGWHPIEILYRPSSDRARFGMYWSSDQFLAEPITSWFHLPADANTSQDWETGRSQIRDLGCVRCHVVPQFDEATKAPRLDKLANHVHSGWLVDYLENDIHGKSGLAPSITLNRAEAVAMTAALLNADSTVAEEVNDSSDGDATAGEELFHSVGCLACHSVNGIGSTRSNSRSLSKIGEKRTKAFFSKWLTDPSSLDPDHQMPEFDFTSAQVHDLTAFLTSLRSGDDRSTPHAESHKLGRVLISQHNCHVCHEVPRSANSASVLPIRTPLSSASRWDHSCVAHASRNQASFSVSDATKRSMVAFVSVMESIPQSILKTALSSIEGKDLIRRNNCLSCHSRGPHMGLQSVIEQVTSQHSDLKEHMSAMMPPSLNSVGDKLTDNAIRKATKREGGTRRPWKHVQMPRFNLDDSQLAAVAETFVEEDRVPPIEILTSLVSIDDNAMFVAGSRLVTSDGFGCTSCHAVGKSKPEKAPIHLLGPDLSMLGERIREPWYRRWLKNPANIVPRVEMPSVQQPVRGLLGGNLSNQIAATWHVLNQKRFTPPLPEPVRVVQHSGRLTQAIRSHVLTDVMRYNGHVVVKPFAVGLPNRHNILLDLEHCRMLDWSIGDTAKQRAQGKTWYWQWSGRSLMSNHRTEEPMFHLIVDGKRVSPSRMGQFITEPDGWRHGQLGVTLTCRYVFVIDGRSITVTANDTFQPTDNDRGFLRRMAWAGVPHDATIELTLLDGSNPFIVRGDVLQWESNGLTLTAKTSEVWNDDGTIRISDYEANREVRIEYAANSGAGQIESPKFEPTQASPPTPISVVPGFDSIRLPNDHDAMPTGFSWRRDGTMYFTSLKGRVWAMHDSDGDGVEDTSKVFSDDLAAPFGVAAYEKYVDVINKGGLVRLIDTNGDGRADETRTVASGWGHTDDYHDWAIGLPPDSQGGYFASIACQQDDRSPAAAFLRGKVVWFTPRNPSETNPHLFDVSEVSGGHRFAVGIARNNSGDLFVTDNQGNYNPYNELNHVQLGMRYGFINELEKKTFVDPPLTSPAINIPHPWTRSVNGISFLETPAEMGDKRLFGPFEGHLVGCEYDTRRLVRMSLQRVGDAFQGAVYPFSRVLPNHSNPLLGPITCAVSPRGYVYVGELRDSGWGAGNNTGQIVRLQFSPSTVPCGIGEVRAAADGFEIEFTKPIDLEKAVDIKRYEVASATRDSTPAYGGDDRDRRRETIRQVELSHNDVTQRPIVRLRLDDLRPGFVYEFHVKSLAPNDENFFPSEAFYSLNQVLDDSKQTQK